MSDTYQATVAAFRRALPVWVGIPGNGVACTWGTQADAAHLLGTSQATASRIIAGRLAVTLAQLCHVAERRRVSLARLVAEVAPWAGDASPCECCGGDGTLHRYRFGRGPRAGADDVCPACGGSGAAPPPGAAAPSAGCSHA